MLSKLAFRNMKRSARDYLVYILTMTIVTALMYAFNSLLFQNQLKEYFEQADIMAVMIGLATVFIVWIVAWLIHYMIRFMLEKRSSEFGIYLLLGMQKKDVSRLYMRENILLGVFSFLLGSLVGILLQQVLTAIMFAMVRMEYQPEIRLNRGTILMTVFCYMGCYLLALLRCRRKFRKMNIHDLMEAKRRNEEIREKHEEIKRILLPLSILFILAFWVLLGELSDAGEIGLFLIGLVLTIYLFYMGLSAWIICYIRKKGNGIYKGQRLFLLRQFAAKVRTMQVTMGTLTALFTLALMGASIALMFSEYENTVLESKFPFDLQIYSSDAAEDFAAERAVLEEYAQPRSYYSYRIYTDGDDQVNTWILTHLNEWKGICMTQEGEPDTVKIEALLETQGCYYRYDTYMGISDYNNLRKLLGYSEAALGTQEYLVQIKPRLEEEVQNIGADLRILNEAGDAYLSCAGIYAEPFSQDGHNGADYLIVVPDEVLLRMQPYYSELVAELEGEVPPGLQDRLADLTEDRDFPEYAEWDIRIGSDNIISYAAIHLVRENLIPELKYALGALIIPLFYIGLVFVCVAVTVLSVQQLSDSAKYRFRYDVLAKLGLEQAGIRRLILKQLAAYYLCPAILATIISGKMILSMSKGFVVLTGVPASPGGFFARSIALFFGIYLVYFTVTYISFRRNVE